MKRCPKCGKEYPAEAGFCIVDGTKLEAAVVTPRAATQAPPTQAPPPQTRPNEDPPTSPAMRRGTSSRDSPTQEFQAKPAVARAPTRGLQEVLEALPKRKAEPAQEPPAKPVRQAKPGKQARKKPARPTPRRVASKRHVPSFSRMRNPWLSALEEDAPQSITTAVREARASRKAKKAAEAKSAAFSDTLWFLEGADPEAAHKLEEDGAVELDEGRYEKKRELPSDVRSDLSLITQEIAPGGPGRDA